MDWRGMCARQRGIDRSLGRAPANHSLEPTWPARILGLRSILALGWPGGSARGRYVAMIFCLGNRTMDPEQFTELLESKKHVPNDIVRYVSFCIEQNQTNRLINELIRDAVATADGLDIFFEKASKITGHSPEDVLKLTEFSRRDIDPSRIESAIAQLRAIFFLDSQEFNSIVLVPTEEKKSADLVAARDGEKYAVEVINSIYDAPRRFSSQQMAEWAFSRLTSEGKKSQIVLTSAQHACSKGVFIAVISTAATAALQTHEDFLEAASLAWEYIGSPPTLYVCMVTGRVTFGYGPDDAVFPPW